MVVDEVLVLAGKLRLHGIASFINSYAGSHALQKMDTLEVIKLMLEEQDQYKENQKIQQLWKNSGLSQPWARVSDIDFDHDRGVSPSVIKTLESCYWIRKFRHLFFIGLTYSGKSYWVNALANAAIHRGFSVKYYHMSDLMDKFLAAIAKDKYVELRNGSGTSQNKGHVSRLIENLAKPQLLILEDWGLIPIPFEVLHRLYQLIDRRDGKGSLIITSTKATEEWYGYMNCPELAEPILERLFSRAEEEIHLIGESMSRIRRINEDKSHD